jgi:hypothetical protein
MLKVVFSVLFIVLIALFFVLMLQRANLFVATFVLLMGASILVCSWRDRRWQEMSSQYPGYFRAQLIVVFLAFVPAFIGIALIYARVPQNVWIGFITIFAAIFTGFVIYRKKTNNFGIGFEDS